MAEQLKVPKITKFEFLEAVRAGTRDAVWELVSGGNPAPTADFFGAVQSGIEAATKALVREREATTGATRQEPEPSASVAEKGPNHETLYPPLSR